MAAAAAVAYGVGGDFVDGDDEPVQGQVGEAGVCGLLADLVSQLDQGVEGELAAQEVDVPVVGGRG